MKYINQLSWTLLLLLTGCLVSCDQDQEGAIYKSQNAELSFNSSALENASVPAGNPIYTVEVYRGNVSATPSSQPTLSVTIAQGGKQVELAGCTVTNYQFEEGSGKGTVSINVTPLEVGVQATVKLSIADADLSAGGVQTTSFKINKEYDWKSLGMGTYTDNWGWGITYNVEIQKADGFERYRAITPYNESMVKDDGEWGDWLADSACPYVEFWTADSDGCIDFAPFFLGLYYQADATAKIYAYPAAALDKTSTSKWIDSKTLQLSPYYYVPALGGGWDMTQKDGIIVITLP